MTGKLPAVADHLDARADVLAFTAFPKELWRQIWSNNPNQRSAARSADAQMLSVSSPTATPPPTWSARCWPNNTMSGPKAAATCPWTS